MKSEALVDSLAETVEEKHSETLIERLVNEKAEALVDALIDMVEEEEAETLIDTHVKVKSEGYSMLWLTR